MSKVSVALRGWRFPEDEIFDEEGELRPLAAMSADTRNRLIRLSAILGEPCSACWLEHGEENIERANVATIVYGEPMAEIALCDEHEADFLYWYREAGGSEYAGTKAFMDEFHEWFADGNRAPADYGGLEHVDEAPEALPEIDPQTSECIPEVEAAVEDLDEDEAEALDLDLDSLDV